MVAKTQTKPEGPASLRAALRDLSQATRIITACLRKVHPGALTDEVEVAVDRRLRDVERIAALSD